MIELVSVQFEDERKREIRTGKFLANSLEKGEKAKVAWRVGCILLAVTYCTLDDIPEMR